MKLKILIIMICTLILSSQGFARFIDDTDPDTGDSQHLIPDGQGGWTFDLNFNGIADSEEDVPLPGTAECLDWLSEKFPELFAIDTDGDDIPNACDNCINIPNYDQTDTDSSNIGGDACKGQIDLKPEELNPTEEVELCPSGIFDPEEFSGCTCEEGKILDLDEETSEAECIVEEKTPDPFVTPLVGEGGGCNMVAGSNSGMFVILLSTLTGLIIRKTKKN